MNDSGVLLRSVNSFFVGGVVHTLSDLPIQRRRIAMGASEREVDPNGDHTAGQMYAQQYRLVEPRHPLPVLLWHGGGMTGCNWEGTPDGRTGWAWRFLQQGYDVIISDAVTRGRASWPMFPEILPEPPIFRTKNEAWPMFRMGPVGSYASNPDDRAVFAQQQFPVDYFDEFAKQWVPRWADQEESTLAAYDALLDKVGPCIVVGHSQGGGFAVAAAQRRPEFVKAVVAVEPAGMPPIRPEQTCPHLGIWGDYLDTAHPIWPVYKKLADEYWDAHSQPDKRFQTFDLPRMGIPGNSHFPMLDLNSDQIVQLIFDWLDEQRFAFTDIPRRRQL